MFTDQPTGLTTWFTIDNVPLFGAAAIITVGALVLVDMLARRLTARAVARARVRAEQWGTYRAAAARRRARVRARTRGAARSFMDTPAARRTMLAVLTITAIAATVLSAHGVQDALTLAGLTAWWARVAGFVAFEGFLLVMASLSWWHRTTGQSGADVYGALVWAGAGVLALVGYHGGGDWIYAVFAPMAALGFHLLTGAERRRRGAGTTWAASLSAAVRSRVDRAAVVLGRTPTSAETNERERERRRSRVVARAVKAHRYSGRAKGWRVWLFERALADAEARGLLDESGRALIAERCAARYTALEALAPGAVAGTSLWTRAAAPAPKPDAAPAVVSVPAPAGPVDAAAPLASVQPIHRNEAADTDAERAAITLIHANFGANEEAGMWCADYFAEHGKLPTGRELGAAVGVHEATGRTWLKPVRAALGVA